MATITTERTIPDFFRCPSCGAGLSEKGRAVLCTGGHSFARRNSVINFLAESADDLPPVDKDFRAEPEQSGMVKRTEAYLLPWIAANSTGTPRLLEDGCGVGTTVLELANRGVDVYGIDPGWRHALWETTQTGRLHVGDGTRLPFADASFDLVTSSGVLEHVGAHDAVINEPAAQAAYIAEIGRVLRPGGKALLAQPNGAHPFDFWHPITGHSIRVHRPYRDFLPSAPDIRRWVAASAYPLRLRFLPPTNYLAFDRIKVHRYGRLLSPPMQAFMNSMERWPKLIPSPLNPWLVAELTRV